MKAIIEETCEGLLVERKDLELLTGLRKELLKLIRKRRKTADRAVERYRAAVKAREDPPVWLTRRCKNRESEQAQLAEVEKEFFKADEKLMIKRKIKNETKDYFTHENQNGRGEGELRPPLRAARL